MKNEFEKIVGSSVAGDFSGFGSDNSDSSVGISTSMASAETWLQILEGWVESTVGLNVENATGGNTLQSSFWESLDKLIKFS